MMAAKRGKKMKWSNLSLIPILFCFFPILVFGQLQVKPIPDPPISFLPKSYLPEFTTPISSNKSSQLLDLRYTMLSPIETVNNYCAADLAFFCRLEVKIEKATRFPVFFRLGDVQYVNYLEGKISRLQLGY